MDELNSLPYLEQVIRETMRVHAPAAFTQRMAVEDDLLILSKPYIDKEGKSHDSLPSVCPEKYRSAGRVSNLSSGYLKDR
jgi:hypothetical protein